MSISTLNVLAIWIWNFLSARGLGALIFFSREKASDGFLIEP